MSEKQRDDSHFLAIAFTFGVGFVVAMLWRPYWLRVAIGSAFIVIVLVGLYSARRLQQQRRGDTSDSSSVTWDSLVAFACLGIPAAIINGGARLCALAVDPPEINPTALGGILVAEIFALGWSLASVCWGCVTAYMAYHRAWSGAAIATGAALLGSLAAAINLFWLWQ